ncbi:hypothetical protein [Comamonas sp. NLF-1-9]|uniref:hypothetical protein n=1 Tax=Comamonas sp. NLF-1-9 TaxID=2853163 RepID=UPI001C462C20|nr:hypothetical protein [Comamonas sp. NLF-1-9]QXL83629.1 hypothetical protein KUD94_10255 [Comamonas sp. NLF-1-9]
MSGSDRSIHLDIGLPPRSDLGHAAGDGGLPTPGKGGRDEQQLQQDASRMQSLLQQAPSAPAAAPAAMAQHPFELFGQALPGAAAAERPAAPEASALAGLDERLSQMAQRLLVGEGRHGGQAVQMQLADADLPGVVLQVFEDEGALVAEFTCSQEEARERLARNAPWLAEQLAERLQRASLVRVLADDPEDPCPVEARAGRA